MMRIVLYLLLRMLGAFRILLPRSLQQLVMAIELPFANFVWRQGGGVDDAVSAHIERNPTAYKPALLRQLFRSAQDSRSESIAILHLISFLTDAGVKEQVCKYAQTRASHKVKAKIEELIVRSKNW